MRVEAPGAIAGGDIPAEPRTQDVGVRRPGILRAVVLAVTGLVLIGGVFTATITAFLADASPRLAVRLGSPSSAAMLNLADQMLQDLAIAEERAIGNSEAEAEVLAGKLARLAAIRALTERALLHTPLNPRALRMLGQIEIATGDNARATQLMTVATTQSIRETVAVSWLLERSLEQRDLAGSLKYADMAMRTNSQMGPVVGPVLARMAQARDGNREIKRMLADNPPWRKRFLQLLPRSVTDLRTPLDILLHLKETDRPPTREDLRAYLDVLLEQRQYDLAYYTWLQFLPPEQLSSLGLLFNGGFELASTGLPFDWQMPPGTGVTAQIANRDERGGTNALRILFSQGRATFYGVSQLTILPPGSYRLEGLFQGELAGRRGLQWKVTCRDVAAPPIGASRMFIGVSATWTPFEFTFKVPETGCPAQTVQLFLDARSESEKLLTGVAWYDKLSVHRVDDVAVK